MIDWSLPTSEVSKYFTVKDCIWLPRWNRLANNTDGLDDDMKVTLIKSASCFDSVRDLLAHPMNVHSFYRPSRYSPLVGGTDDDVHVQGLSVDFDCLPGLSSDEVKAILMPNLVNFGLRMEDNGPKSSWVHCDRHKVIFNRFFKP